MRLDRNGIPILDPPRNANKIKNPTPCIPGEHDYGPPQEGKFEQDWIMGIEYQEHVQTCRRCGDVYKFTKTFDTYTGKEV